MIGKRLRATGLNAFVDSAGVAEWAVGAQFAAVCKFRDNRRQAPEAIGLNAFGDSAGVFE